ncbi:hypothetical protein QL898_13680 [Psychrobacter sp. APC 3279]|uniref:hypothetical protein n=1 Tax=Psychrobacter sp. APC 3279 TaxID=3035189 RepID=UPI0025B5364C|nr:hypothetical protein [Psychrobacter sp. APC 3279]MDN3442673.1 hypothetical protein [Psychrobacter sp. APC 3279]
MIDLHSSVEIYDHLMNGRIINKRRLGSHGDFESNPMFEEIIKNLELYKNQYDMTPAVNPVELNLGDFSYAA